MMLAWSTCEPPNGYGVTNCSSLSGNALAALVSAKAAAAVVTSEVIDRRVVMISLFATTFLRSPRHRRRLAFGNRQVPSLEVGDVLHLLRCCHAVHRIAWTRTDHRSLRRNSSNTDGASCIAATRNAPSSYNRQIGETLRTCTSKHSHHRQCRLLLCSRRN